jgi:hypothetical protein
VTDEMDVRKCLQTWTRGTKGGRQTYRPISSIIRRRR